MKTTIGLTALLCSCPKQQETKTPIDFSQSLPQIIARHLVEQNLLSERYERLYSDTYETALGEVRVYYKPEGVDVADVYTAAEEELFSDEEYFNDVFILAMQSSTPINYIDIGLNDELHTVSDSSGNRIPYRLLNPEEQAQYGARYELMLIEIVEQLQNRELIEK